MPGRRSSVVVVASFALLAGACGGADEDEREEFVARGNDVCRQLDREFDELGPPPPQASPDAGVWELRVQQLAQRAYGRLEALDAPDDLAGERDALVAAIAANRRHIRRLRTVAEENRRELEAGVSDGPAQREFLNLSAEIEQDARRVQQHFRALGWTDCARLSR